MNRMHTIGSRKICESSDSDAYKREVGRSTRPRPILARTAGQNREQRHRNWHMAFAFETLRVYQKRLAISATGESAPDTFPASSPVGGERRAASRPRC